MFYRFESLYELLIWKDSSDMIFIFDISNIDLGKHFDYRDAEEQGNRNNLFASRSFLK